LLSDRGFRDNYAPKHCGVFGELTNDGACLRLLTDSTTAHRVLHRVGLHESDSVATIL
jgi:hypothetical protein